MGQAPTMIGSYRVLQLLGEGGMGAVYLAEHTLIGRRAAIKVLHPAFSARQEIIERFFNEARATTSIQDPGIVQVFDFGYHNGVAFIVMEYLQGESLQMRLRRMGRLGAPDVLRLTRQIALSLHAAHARGVVHRDLKPDNVFVVPDPEAVGGERTKILDFGIAKLSDTADHQRTQTGLVMGTPSYMSPEQCRGAGSVDHRADVYSLGCMMFHFLTGRLPFEAEGAGELIAMHLREPAMPPSRFVPMRPEIDAIVLRCLAKQPNERYQTMHQLAVDIDHLLRIITVPPGTMLQSLTPLPPPQTLPPPTPTTLSSMVGQSAYPAPARSRAPLFGFIALVLVGGTVAATVAITKNGGGGADVRGSGDPAAAKGTTPDPAPTPDPHTVAPTPTPPVPTPPVPTPPVADPTPPSPTPPVADPTPPVPTASGSDASKPTQPKPPKHPKTPKTPKQPNPDDDPYGDR
jgi:serine/threonine protein kinase